MTDCRQSGRADLAVHGDAQAAGIDGPLQDAGGSAGTDVVQGVGMGQSQGVGQRVALAGPPVAVPVNDQGIGLFHHPHVERGDLPVAVFVRDGPQVEVQGHTVLGGASGVAGVVGVGCPALCIHGEAKGPHQGAFLGHMVSSGFGGPEKSAVAVSPPAGLTDSDSAFLAVLSRDDVLSLSAGFALQRLKQGPVPPLCGDTGLQKRSKVFSGSA